MLSGTGRIGDVLPPTHLTKVSAHNNLTDACPPFPSRRYLFRATVWAIIGLLFILTPPVIIVIAVLTGAIPGFANIGN